MTNQTIHRRHQLDGGVLSPPRAEAVLDRPQLTLIQGGGEGGSPVSEVAPHNPSASRLNRLAAAGAVAAVLAAASVPFLMDRFGPSIDNKLNTCSDKTEQVVVHSGDTLWEISHKIGPGASAEIHRLNPDLPQNPEDLQPGTVLDVPRDC